MTIPALLEAPRRSRSRRLLPGLDPDPVATERCVYDNSADTDFVLDRVGHVVVGCGTSGHGFKFGPLLGELLADLAEGGRPRVDLRPFALRRAETRARLLPVPASLAVVPRYVALLRSVNVAGHGRIAMSELRATFERLGYEDVTTYIQTGNVLFSTPSRQRERRSRPPLRSSSTPTSATRRP